MDTTRNDELEDVAINHRETESRGNLKFVILASIGVVFFWFLFELYGYTQNFYLATNESVIFGWMMPDILVNSIPAVALLILLIPYYFVATKLSITLKIALGCTLFAALWLIYILFYSSNLIALGLFSILSLGFIEAVIDLFVTPTILALICRYSPKKIYGTLLGIYSVLCLGGIMLATSLSDETVSLTTNIIFGVALVGVAVYFFILPRVFRPEGNALLENPEVI